ncbi:MAG: ATP-binding protein, partial [Mariprofundaceae bacterium]|nr:ATP-binding protein [Mariprofundaceae bacterium]
MRKKFRSIRYKLALLFALCSVIGIALSSLGTFLYTSHQARDESLNGLTEIAKLMRNTMVAAIEFEDLESINSTLNSVRNNPKIQALFVYNARQKLVASHILEGTEQHELRELVQEQNITHKLTEPFHFRNRTFLLVSSPVVSEGEYIGTLTVVGNTKRLQSSLYSIMFVQFIAGLIALGLVLFLAFRIQKNFTLPIFKLRTAMQDFSHNPDADARVLHDSGDEFNSLFDGYHYMLDVIKDRNHELAFQRAALDEHAIVTTFDADGIITQCNDTFCSISGYARDELINIDHRQFLSDAHPDSFYQNIYTTVADGHVWRGEVNSKAKDGHYYWVSASIVPFMNEQGKPFKYIAVRTDITERKEAVETMRLARELAEASTRSKSDFLSRMSHEIRTPMNAIIGMTHLALQTDLNAQQHDYLMKSQGAAQSLLSLINDILDFSKIEAGKLEMEHVSFDLEQVLNNLATITGLSSEEKGLEMYFSVPPSVPLRLLGDPLRLGQVLLNLCNNAIKFTDHGEVSVNIRSISRIADQAILEFTVQDSGIGLSAEQLDSLFQSFNQADISITRKYGGTGLGLAISKQLVELMGGEISVESEVGQGSRFIFTVAFDVDVEAKKQVVHTLDDLRDMRVLVVDDSETSLKIMRQYLEHYAFHVDVAKSGNEAIAMLKSQAHTPYQLVFMDWNMPGVDGMGMNGIEAARKIRGLSGLVRLPTIIMVTAHARDEVVGEADEEEFDGFLTKPVNQSSLMDTVISTLSQSEGLPRPTSQPDDAD